MNVKLLNILIIILFTILLVGTAIAQLQIKFIPQICLLFFDLLILLIFIIGQGNISTIVFYIFIGLRLFINFCMLTYWIIHIINPNGGISISENGETHLNMDLATPFFSGLAALLFTPLVIYLYHKKIKRNRKIEMTAIVVFIVSTICICIIKYK